MLFMSRCRSAHAFVPWRPVSRELYPGVLLITWTCDDKSYAVEIGLIPTSHVLWSPLLATFKLPSRDGGPNPAPPRPETPAHVPGLLLTVVILIFDSTRPF